MWRLLVIMLVLAAMALVFVFDPAGVIAEYIIPDFGEMGWKQLTAWAFRVPGTGLALLLVIPLWILDFKWREAKHPKLIEPVTRPPSGLSAAAVSVLESRQVNDRTLLTSVVEMCQRGMLEITPARRATRRGKYSYKLTARESTTFDWERLVCDQLPTGPVTVERMGERLGEQKEAVGDGLGEYLQYQGLFSDNPIRVMREHHVQGAWAVILAVILLGVGVGLWLELWISQWWINAIAGGVLGFIYFLIFDSTNVGKLKPTESGLNEIGQWLGLKEYLAGLGPGDAVDGSDQMLAYAIALDAAGPWLNDAVPAPSWFGATENPEEQGLDLDQAYHFFLSAKTWNLTGRNEGVDKVAAEETQRESASSAPRPVAGPSGEPPELGAAPVASANAPALTSPEPQQVFYDAGRVFVSANLLRFPGKTVTMNRVKSAVVVEVEVEAETGSNKFLKVVGNLIKWPPVSGATGLSIIFLWGVLFAVLDQFGFIAESRFADPYAGGNPSFPFNTGPGEYLLEKWDDLAETISSLIDPSTVAGWLFVGAVILGATLAALLGHQIVEWGTAKTTKYRAGIDATGESEWLYSGEYEERAEAERIVSAIELARAAGAAPVAPTNAPAFTNPESTDGM